MNGVETKIMTAVMNGVETKIMTAVIGDNLNPTVFCR